ncbi:MAG: LysR family transcriptional regulator [Mesorhizobium sp.]|nr:MAG: LysR family transcriptional regulator [Mesorhizobium sp.]TJW42350.1 MAG: LysR family transcriptional regulator [Mesorhizobium sp.]
MQLMRKANTDQLKLRRLDFTMLAIFRDLVRLQKTTRVAATLGVSQSAVSHALARLRELFDDPLFIRRPNGLEPTPRASQLLPQIEIILRLAHEALDVPTHFEPETSSRTFRLGGNDLVGAVIAPPLIGMLRAEAPRCRVAFQFAVGAESLNALRTNEMEMAIGRVWDLPDEFQAMPIFEEDFVVVVRKDHPVAHGPISLDHYLALDHVLVSFRGGFHGMVDQALKKRRLRRRVVASVPMFMTAMGVVANSDLSSTVPARLAAKYANQFGLAVLEPPLAVDPFTFSLVRHVRSASDIGLDWLSAKIIECAGSPQTGSTIRQGEANGADGDKADQ